MREIPEHHDFFNQPRGWAYSAEIGEDDEGETIWAIWDMKGKPLESESVKLGKIVAVEARTVEEGMA